MSHNIEFPNDSFDFSKITLANPVILQQQNYFSKINANSNELMIQMPRCTSKQGFVNSSKRYYCDLMFSAENSELLSWFEKLDEKINGLIYDQRKSWFHEDVDPDDIENIFTSSLRSYKSGKFFLCRAMTNSPRMLQTTKLSIFDENENPLEMSNVDNNTEFVSILHIHGIKFSSRNFQIYIEMKQMMVLNNTPTFTKCLIQNGGSREHMQQSSETPELLLENEIVKENLVVESREHMQQSSETPELLLENEIVKENLVVESKEPMQLHEVEIDDTPIKDISNDFIVESEETTGDESNDEDEVNNASIDDETNEEDKVNNSHIDDEIHKDLEINNELPNELQEINLTFDNLETIQLKNKQDIYLSEYKEAKEKAKKARIIALKALLKAKNIKDKYLIDTMELSDDEYDEDNTTIHSSDLESNVDSLESFSDDGNENDEGLENS